MSMALRRLGPHGVNLVVLHGVIDRSELIGFYRGIDPEDPANALPWLTYVASGADLSDVDIAAFAELKRTIEPIRRKVERSTSFCSVVVSGSEQSDALVEFWHDFIAKDSDHPPYTVLFSGVKNACRELHLTGSAPEAIIGVIRSVLAPPQVGRAGAGRSHMSSSSRP